MYVDFDCFTVVGKFQQTKRKVAILVENMLGSIDSNQNINIYS